MGRHSKSMKAHDQKLVTARAAKAAKSQQRQALKILRGSVTEPSLLFSDSSDEESEILALADAPLPEPFEISFCSEHEETLNCFGTFDDASWASSEQSSDSEGKSASEESANELAPETAEGQVPKQTRHNRKKKQELLEHTEAGADCFFREAMTCCPLKAFLINNRPLPPPYSIPHTTPDVQVAHKDDGQHTEENEDSPDERRPQKPPLGHCNTNAASLSNPSLPHTRDNHSDMCKAKRLSGDKHGWGVEESKGVVYSPIGKGDIMLLPTQKRTLLRLSVEQGGAITLQDAIALKPKDTSFALFSASFSSSSKVEETVIRSLQTPTLLEDTTPLIRKVYSKRVKVKRDQRRIESGAKRVGGDGSGGMFRFYSADGKHLATVLKGKMEIVHGRKQAKAASNTAKHAVKKFVHLQKPHKPPPEKGDARWTAEDIRKAKGRNLRYGSYFLGIWNASVHGHEEARPTADSRSSAIANRAHGLDLMTPVGSFRGGKLYLDFGKEDTYVVEYKPGDIVILKGAVVVHWIGRFEGERYGLVWFSHEETQSRVLDRYVSYNKRYRKHHGLQSSEESSDEGQHVC
ncbi:hypothetical protein BT69DRAFT_1388710, partial [Atractiella rhizophila]